MRAASQRSVSACVVQALVTALALQQVSSPVVMALEQADDVEQRALARARWPDQRHELGPRPPAKSMPCSTSVSTGVPGLYRLRMLCRSRM
jgi:anti-sigma factor RsiW